MKGSKKVIEALNDVLGGELVGINQYFLHSKMCKNWGFERLAEHDYKESIGEMKHASDLTERILFLEGVPNLQKLGKLSIGETVPEQLRLAAQLEEKAVGLLHAAISGAEAAADPATALMLREMLLGEEAQLDWIEAQMGLIDRVGEANYLSQKINK